MANIHAQPCCVLSHLDPSRQRFPLPGFCEHGVYCTAHAMSESRQESLNIGRAAVGEAYDTRDTKTVMEDIKKDVEEGEWPHHTERSVGSG